MNMKMDENLEDSQDITGRPKYRDDGDINFDIDDPNIDIELPEGAKAGLKDAS